MTERIPNHHENQDQRTSFEVKHEQHEKAEHKQAATTEVKKPEKKLDSVEELKQKIEASAVKSETYTKSSEASHAEHTPMFVNRELKSMAYSRTMVRVRKNLNPFQAQFSKFIHNSTVDSASEIIGKTIARPKPVLFAGIFTSLGLFILLLLTRKYGYEYNYLAVIILFSSGYTIGLFFEFLTRQKEK
jgi:hypothetical protein